MVGFWAAFGFRGRGQNRFFAMRSDLFHVHFLVNEVFKRPVWQGFLALDRQLIDDAATVFFAHRPNDATRPFQTFLVEKLQPVASPLLGQTSWFWRLLIEKIKNADTEQALDRAVELAAFFQKTFGLCWPSEFKKLEADNLFLYGLPKAIELPFCDEAAKTAIFEGIAKACKEQTAPFDPRAIFWALQIFAHEKLPDGFLPKKRPFIFLRKMAESAVWLAQSAMPKLEARFGRDRARFVWASVGRFLLLVRLIEKGPETARVVRRFLTISKIALPSAPIESAIDRLPDFLLHSFKKIGSEDLPAAAVEHLAAGKTARELPRFLGFPSLRMSPRAAHLLMTEVPKRVDSLQKGIVWSQAAAFEHSIGQRFLNRKTLDVFAFATVELAFSPFLEEIVRFFLKNELEIQDHQFRPMLDFFQNRYENEPNYSLRGRTVASVTRAMEEWHRDLALQTALEGLPKSWSPTRLKPFMGDAVDDQRSFRIREITEAVELIVEGREMHHCVASYIKKCAAGESSIWSLRLRDERRVTIEVERSCRIVQARGPQNRYPTETERAVIEKWAQRERLLFVGA